MKIAATILALKTNETVNLEEEGSNRLFTLLKFQGKLRKYANHDHKVLHVATDDMTVYSELKENYPGWNIDLIEKELA